MGKAIAVISDIHSNLEALEAVLADIKDHEISEIVCLGDIVGYASGVRACLRRIRALACPVVMGNHDEAACLVSPPLDFNETARAGTVFSSQCLNEEELAWLKSLPLRLKIADVEYFHASLETLVKWNYILSSSEARRHFSNQITSLAFCGHTHHPTVWFQPTVGGHVSMNYGEGTKILPLNGKVLINVGSVGQPRDGDNRACYVIHRPEEKCVEFRRIPYDIARTKKKILRARLPRFSAQRLSLGR